MSDEAISFLENKAKWLRTEVLDMSVRSNIGHIVSAFSCIEILVTLFYGGLLRLNSSIPDWDDRDRFILSKGHAAVALYPILADLGFFSKELLSGFCQKDCMLGEHPDPHTSGVEIITGSLGHGLSIGSGIALAAERDKKNFLTVVLLSDGECYEGSTWEAAMFAAHQDLNNLIAIIDYNKLSTLGPTTHLVPLDKKWESFGWEVITANGHSVSELLNVFSFFGFSSSRREVIIDKPLAIIANTVKGKGVSFMENEVLWHVLVPKGDEIERALKEIEGGLDG